MMMKQSSKEMIRNSKRHPWKEEKEIADEFT